MWLCNRHARDDGTSYVFGAAPLVGTRIQKSSQDTTPSADNARNPKAEKNEKTAQRGRLSLDKRGPHTCSAWTMIALVGPFEDSPNGAHTPFFNVPQIVGDFLEDLLRDKYMGPQGRQALAGD